ncbi:hypothetical protein C8R44DRAFT_987579 [Mycena epipterygia]|nr:hypothetical protein C8R44DRAFT_987579 [Mycena epipterygia]
MSDTVEPSTLYVPRNKVMPSEILAPIFEEVGWHADLQALYATRTTLRSAALTCRSFCSPALDVLWRSIDNLLPLLELLPSFKVVEGNHTISGMIKASDWARFDCYAQRVHRVAYRGGSIPVIHPSVYLSLAILHPHPLLPNLLSVEYHGPHSSGATPFPEALLLVSPTVRHVKISSSGLEVFHTTNFLSTLAGKSTQLSSLLFYNQPHAVLDNILSSFTYLRELHVMDMLGQLKAKTLRSMAQLEHLNSLSIDLISLNPFSTFAIGHLPLHGQGHRRFPALELLRIQCSTLAMLIVFLDMTTPGTLKTLIIDGRMSLHPFDGARFCQKISCGGSLHRLEISNVVGSIATSLNPLDLRHLRIFDLRNSPSLSLAGVDVTALATAWPALTCLAIPSGDLDLPSLNVLAANCPDLAYLQITLSTLNVPPFTMTPVRRHVLRDLHLSNSLCSAGSVHLLARHFDRLFPRLQSICAGGPDQHRWKEVESMVFAFQDVRLHALAQT